ncbi:MAG: hypothetical protein WC989_01705 [Micavibrio sp.]
MSKNFPEKSYMHKLAFYAFILALPLLLMTAASLVAAQDIAAPPLTGSGLMVFLVYFLPGIMLTRRLTESWRKTIGVGIAYAMISPAYYLYATDYACRIKDSCITV